ncbi:MAG TPA: ankyrin repeat domain-containing protein [Bryobacteraceae bacterium]
MPAQKDSLLENLGGEPACLALSKAFYARVGRDPILRPLFPGKTLRCATEEFAAFLIQFLGGDENQTQHRWWLSLRESHARFRVTPAQREAWLKNMRAALDETIAGASTRTAFRQFFEHTSAYVVDHKEDTPAPSHPELTERWNRQLALDRAIAALDAEGVTLAPHFRSRPAVFTGLLARMLQSGRPHLVDFVRQSIEADPSLATRRFGGWTLLHHAAAAGTLEIVELVLKNGAAPDLLDRGGHTPLYRVANGCASPAGPAIVRALTKAGADVNASAGVTRSTPLHAAARRGHTGIARTLLELGADPHARDTKGATPLQRAINCRKKDVAGLLGQPLTASHTL